MTKSNETMLCEKAIYREVKAGGLGVYGCFECTLGAMYGDERVDFITMTSDSVFRCYEIKVSKSDFHSKAKKSFYGDYNYFVMPAALFEQLSDDDLKKWYWDGVGVYTVNANGRVALVHKAKKKTVPIFTRIMLMHGMVRSLSRYCKSEFE